MKNYSRALVLVLALSGMSAAAYSNVIASHDVRTVTASKATAFPIPTCPWNDPNECGMGGPKPSIVGTK